VDTPYSKNNNSVNNERMSLLKLYENYEYIILEVCTIGFLLIYSFNTLATNSKNKPGVVTEDQ